LTLGAVVTFNKAVEPLPGATVTSMLEPASRTRPVGPLECPPPVPGLWFRSSAGRRESEQLWSGVLPISDGAGAEVPSRAFISGEVGSFSLKMRGSPVDQLYGGVIDAVVSGVG
jgi:hypothetical protein